MSHRHILLSGPTPTRHHRWRRDAGLVTCGVLTSCCIAISSCSRSDAPQPAPTGQVIADVGTQVVTTSELLNEFRLANTPAAKQKDPAVIKRAVADLVLRKYLMQRAINLGLDREPNTLLDLMRAREQVLASAVMTRKVDNEPISNTDIEKYIADHPASFSERLMLSVDQITFAIGPNFQAAFEGNKAATSLDEVDRKLTSLGIVHTRSSGALSEENLPETLLQALQARKPDDVFFARSGPRGTYFKVLAEQSHPLDGEAATKLARQLLRADALKSFMAIASDTASHEAKYEGSYATLMGTPTESGAVVKAGTAAASANSAIPPASSPSGKP
jgi:EpsD family peptidyl-prolyl cis-trans isomerase